MQIMQKIIGIKMSDFLTAISHKTFCKLPFQKNETLIDMRSCKNHIIVATNQGRYFFIDEQGNFQQVINFPNPT